MKAQEIHEKHKIIKSSIDKVVLAIIAAIGTIWFVIFCVMLTFTPIAFPNTLFVVQFISSAFLQLTLLPIILIGQNYQSAEAERKAKYDHEINLKTEKEVEQIMKLLKK